jgi:hypothetical protein
MPSMADLRDRSAAIGASTFEVWTRCIQIGAAFDLLEVEAYLFEALLPTDLDAAVLAQAVWELEEFPGPDGQ